MVERYRIFAFTTFYRADSMASPLQVPIACRGEAMPRPRASIASLPRNQGALLPERTGASWVTRVFVVQL